MTLTVLSVGDEGATASGDGRASEAAATGGGETAGETAGGATQEEGTGEWGERTHRGNWGVGDEGTPGELVSGGGGHTMGNW